MAVNDLWDGHSIIAPNQPYSSTNSMYEAGHEFAGRTYANVAIGGQYIVHVAPWLPSRLRTYTPQKYYVMIGTNGVFPYNSALGGWSEIFYSYLVFMIEQVIISGCEFHFLEILPANIGSASDVVHCLKYNARIKQLCARYGVYFHEGFNLLSDSPAYPGALKTGTSSDGVHPNTTLAGGLLLNQQVLNGVIPELDQNIPIVPMRSGSKYPLLKTTISKTNFLINTITVNDSLNRTTGFIPFNKLPSWFLDNAREDKQDIEVYHESGYRYPRKILDNGIYLSMPTTPNCDAIVHFECGSGISIENDNFTDSASFSVGSIEVFKVVSNFIATEIYSYRQKITLPSTSSEIRDSVITLSNSSDESKSLPYALNAQVNPTYNDLDFYYGDTKLKKNIIALDALEWKYRIEIENIAQDGDKDIYCYWGAPSVTAPVDNDLTIYRANNVFSFPLGQGYGAAPFSDTLQERQITTVNANVVGGGRLLSNRSSYFAFNGAMYVNAGDSGLSFPEAFSIGFAIKTNDINVSADIIVKLTEFGIYIDSSKLAFQIMDEGSGYTYRELSETDTANILDNNIHYVVCTWDGSTPKIIVDGVRKDSGGNSVLFTAMHIHAGYISMGYAIGFMSHGLAGNFGNFEMWKEAISESEAKFKYDMLVGNYTLGNVEIGFTIVIPDVIINSIPSQLSSMLSVGMPSFSMNSPGGSLGSVPQLGYGISEDVFDAGLSKKIGLTLNDSNFTGESPDDRQLVSKNQVIGTFNRWLSNMSEAVTFFYRIRS
jgi:hypothetical protein